MSSREERERIAAMVRQAFHGVTLGDGIGLRQAEGMDRLESSASLAAKVRG